ncbi:lycopene cyclase family protein [uncultured Polaribacter sp.]|uniref:lycopene cyclase family protein n=1 Tax=uncultured Polaribacter sp. TaxID=174711 RepID=UPI0030D92415|tara:strand:- start:4066 stop:5208 length:1143 start_codon:yes stop_codon:yes gene_type:complete
MKYYDYIIVGGGAAGLMMAYRMAKDVFFDDKKILIIDKVKKTTNDKTWCYWETKNGDWDDLLTTSWNTILFESDSLVLEENIAPYSYKMIRSSNFYAQIWKTLEHKNNIHFLEENVVSIHQQKEDAKIITEKAVYTTKTLLNSILFDPSYKKQTTYPLLQQHFVGFFIKTKEDTFKDTTATFMDFTVPQNGNTRFMYVLPISKTEALFEYTLFSSDLLAFDVYKTAIEKYLERKNITNYTIIEQEQGAIPMTCYKFWNKNSTNIMHIGTAGGWSKASTGFTFKNINKKTKELVEHIKDQKPFSKFHKINKFWFYDLLLLDILHEKNYLGANIFSKMFQKSPTHKILKFLDEETSIFEDFQIILKMPPYYFIRALFRRFLS